MKKGARPFRPSPPSLPCQQIKSVFLPWLDKHIIPNQKVQKYNLKNSKFVLETFKLHDLIIIILTDNICMN